MEDIQNNISISGTSNEIPYNESNLVYKAIDLYLKKANIKRQKKF